MKKTLIALAAVAATGAAFAQSSVTLYGVADVAVGKTNTAVISKAGTPFNPVTGAAAVPDAYIMGMGNDKFQAIASNVLNNGNSRFGLKGTEDLGGGLKAGFNFEGGINIANGAGNTSGGELFSRAANVSLMGGFGEIRAGRSLTTSFYSVAAWELTGTANYSVVANQFSFGGSAPRDSAQVMYNSPNMGGLTFSASTVLKANGALNKNADKSKYDLAIGYAAGPLTAGFAYNKVSGNDASWVAGGKYNFGAFAVAGSYNNVGVTGVGAAGTDKKGFTLGVSAPVGPVTLTADIARATNDQYKNTDFVLEAKYALSKRTFAYAVFMRDGGVSNVKSVNGYAVGLRHNF